MVMGEEREREKKKKKRKFESRKRCDGGKSV
jgi:hypothetical protein